MGAQSIERKSKCIKTLALSDPSVLDDKRRAKRRKFVVYNCRVPDDWLLQNRRALLLGREVLKAVMAAFKPGSQAT